MTYKHIDVPAQGEKIRVNEDNSLNVPANPVIPFIEGRSTTGLISRIQEKK